MSQLKVNLSAESDIQREFTIPFNSSISLIMVNAATIIIALWQNWAINELVWVYWLQSVIIGYFQQKKIRDLEKFSTERFYINEKPVEATEETKNKVANLFILTFGLFHFFYLFFIVSLEIPDLKGLSILGILYFANHYFSYLQNKNIEKKKYHNIGEMMMAPYLRVIPIHLTVILGLSSGNRIPLFTFLILKSIVDVAMHNIEHLAGSFKIKTETI